MSSLLVLLCCLVGIRGHFLVNLYFSYNLLRLLKHPLVDSSESQTSICTLRDGDDDQLLVSVMHAVDRPGRGISTWRMRLHSSTLFMNIVTRQWLVGAGLTFALPSSVSGNVGQIAVTLFFMRRIIVVFVESWQVSSLGHGRRRRYSKWVSGALMLRNRLTENQIIISTKISTIFMTNTRTWIKVVPRIPCCRDSVPASAETRIVFQRREGIVVHRLLLDLGGHNADWPTLTKDHKWISSREIEKIRRCFLKHFYWLRESTQEKNDNKNTWQI